MACVHDTRSIQQRHVDAGGGIEGRPSSTDRGATKPGSKCDGVTDKKCSVVVALEKGAFSCMIV